MKFFFNRFYNLLNTSLRALYKSRSTSPNWKNQNYNEPIVVNSKVGSFNQVGDNCYLYNTTLEDFSYIGSYSSVMNTTIGKFCSIGRGVSICTGMHPSKIFVSTHPAFFSVNKQCGITFAEESHFKEMGTCTIGNDVWIGTHAIIMDDIVIGDGAIIGAGAVVTKNVPPYGVVVGNPARVIRFRFTTDEINFLLALKWWDKDPAWLKENYLKFHNIIPFMNEFANANH